MSTAPMLSRHLGDYLLVAHLSEDALGSVFRALYAADERRFVRLRILRSSELSGEAVEAAIRENATRVATLAHPAIVDRTLLDVVDGVPFMTWEEMSGWTLDTMLARVRAFDIRVPAEYALLIVERIAAGLEHAHRTESAGRPTHHGLLWPGFVSISQDASVRVGGFGLAEGVLSSLTKPRLAAEVAPYLAPESRDAAIVDPQADVYALGVILAELLTGRRPTLDSPPPELRAGDPRSDELETFLHRCMAPRTERFASAVDAHREIQRMVTGSPFSLYTANLALFFYKLLNPESQITAPSSDWESTNPVVLDGSATLSRSRRKSVALVAPVESMEAEAAQPVAPIAMVAAESPVSLDAVPPSEAEDEEPVELVVEIEAVVSTESSLVLEAALPAAEEPATTTTPVAASATEEAVVFLFPKECADAAPSTSAFEHAVASDEAVFGAPPVLPPEVTAGPVRLWATAWIRPASALAAAAGLTLGAFLLVSQFHAQGLVGMPAKLALAAAPSAPQPASSPARAPEIAVAAAAPMAVVLSGSAGRFETAGARSDGTAGARLAGATRKKPVPLPSRQPAEDLRLRAALARIEADRVDARQTAGNLFGEGRHNEEEGERLMRQSDYQAAELAFSRAARLFQQAQEISWEQRLRQSNLSNSQ